MKFIFSIIAARALILGLQSPNTIYASGEDFEITNEDTDLNVAIDPPIRISLFETSQQLSDSGVDAFLKAASAVATSRMQAYFAFEYDSKQYIFERVEFEAIKVEPLVSGRRNLRVFEREEANLVNRENLLSNGGHSAYNRTMEVMEVENDQNRHLQTVEYGTAFTLGGNFTFGAIPAAPSAELNRKLQEDMLKNLWPLRLAIQNQNNAELNPRATKPFLAEVLTPEPTPSPSKAPIKALTTSPTTSPTNISATAFPSGNPIDSHSPIHSSPPTEVSSLGPSKSPDTPNGFTGMLPVIISAGIFAVIAIGLVGFYMKGRSNKDKLRISDPKLLIHKSFDCGDSGLNVDDGSLMQIGAGSTKDIESGESGSLNDSVDSSNFANVDQSITTSETVKAGNVIDTPKKVLQTWFKMSPAKSVGKVLYKKTPTKEPEHEVLPFPVKLNNSACSESSTSLFDNIDDVDVASPVTTKFPSPQSIQSDEKRAPIKAPLVATLQGSPVTKAHFGKDSDQITSTPSPASRRLNSMKGSEQQATPGSASRRLNASPVVTVTPSKVSKEEFDQEWREVLPFNWNPTPAKSETKWSKKKKQKDASKSNNDIDIEGSFPTFDIVDDPPISPPTQRISRANSSILDASLGTSMHSILSANQSGNDMHPMDWSNKGSEFDSTSVGDSTFTDGDGTGKYPSQDFQWQRRLNPYSIDDSDNLSRNKDNVTPNSESSRKSLGSRSLGSSPSSKGSSKQLIHDIVWLEKKIADVRARVDRLDGDESQTTGSLPTSPTASDIMNRSARSPASTGSSISANIICRDVLAPPGKLQIIIRSTKDGPAILHVKPGSILNGQIFAGDLIVSVNDIDTRAYDAEGVTELMAQKSNSERKITVLHAV